MAKPTRPGLFLIGSLSIGSDFLFNGQNINDVKYNGAGHLWISTSEGVFLYNKEVSQQIVSFNTTNSPLLSSDITKIGINEDNGEVLFYTPEGIFVYYDAATTASSSQSDNVSIYPNPVNPNYSGNVTIRGLVRNANVKITDISGNLVYELDAEGGTAIWDTKLLNGSRAKTGVYLLFSSNEDGTETYIGKIAVITE